MLHLHGSGAAVLSQCRPAQQLHDHLQYTTPSQRHTSLAGRDADELTRMHVCREQCRARSNSQPYAGRLLTLCYMIHTFLSNLHAWSVPGTGDWQGGWGTTLSGLHGQLARCHQGPEPPC